MASGTAPGSVGLTATAGTARPQRANATPRPVRPRQQQPALPPVLEVGAVASAVVLAAASDSAACSTASAASCGGNPLEQQLSWSASSRGSQTFVRTNCRRGGGGSGGGGLQLSSLDGGLAGGRAVAQTNAGGSAGSEVANHGTARAAQARQSSQTPTKATTLSAVSSGRPQHGGSADAKVPGFCDSQPWTCRRQRLSWQKKWERWRCRIEHRGLMRMVPIPDATLRIAAHCWCSTGWMLLRSLVQMQLLSGPDWLQRLVLFAICASSSRRANRSMTRRCPARW